MPSTPALSEWNRPTVALTQALLGAISPYFRMVWLNHDDVDWQIAFVLEKDDDTDREEIKDIVTQFEALQDGPIGCNIELNITCRPLPGSAPPARVVYRRREE